MMEEFTFRRFNEQDALILHSTEFKFKPSPRKKKMPSPSRSSNNYSNSYSSPRTERTFQITSQSDAQYIFKSADDQDSLMHLRYSIQSDIAQLLTEIHPLRKRLKDMEEKSVLQDEDPPPEVTYNRSILASKSGEAEYIQLKFSDLSIGQMRANLFNEFENLNFYLEQCRELKEQTDQISRKKNIFLASDIYKKVCDQRVKINLLNVKIEQEEHINQNVQNELEDVENNRFIEKDELPLNTDSPENIARLQKELLEKQAALNEVRERYSRVLEYHEKEISNFHKEHAKSFAPPKRNNTNTNGRFKVQKPLKLSFSKSSVDEYISSSVSFASTALVSNDFDESNSFCTDINENNDSQKIQTQDLKKFQDFDPLRKKTNNSPSPRQIKSSSQWCKSISSMKKQSSDCFDSTLNSTLSPRSPLSPTSRCISVGLFAKPIQAKEIKNLFSQYGDIENVEILTKSHVYPSQYYANIRFDCHESAQRSIDKANHKKYKNTVLSVKWATNQSCPSNCSQTESAQNTLKYSNSSSSSSPSSTVKSPRPPPESPSKSHQRPSKSGKSSSQKSSNNNQKNSSSNNTDLEKEKITKNNSEQLIEKVQKSVLSLSSTIVQETPIIPSNSKSEQNTISGSGTSLSSNISTSKNLISSNQAKMQEPTPEIQVLKVQPQPKTDGDKDSKSTTIKTEINQQAPSKKEKLQLPPLKINAVQIIRNNIQSINSNSIENKETEIITQPSSNHEKKENDKKKLSKIKENNQKPEDHQKSEIKLKDPVEILIINDDDKNEDNKKQIQPNIENEISSDTSRSLFSSDSDNMKDLQEDDETNKTNVDAKSPKLPDTLLDTSTFHSPRPRFLGVFSSPFSKEAEQAKAKEKKTFATNQPTDKEKSLSARPKINNNNYHKDKKEKEESIKSNSLSSKDQNSISESEEMKSNLLIDQDNENSSNKNKKDSPSENSEKSDKHDDKSSDSAESHESDSSDKNSEREKFKNKIMNTANSNSDSSKEKKSQKSLEDKNKKMLDQTYGFSVSNSSGEQSEFEGNDEGEGEKCDTKPDEINSEKKDIEDKNILNNVILNDENRKILDRTFGFSVPDQSGESSEENINIEGNKSYDEIHSQNGKSDSLNKEKKEKRSSDESDNDHNEQKSKNSEEAKKSQKNEKESSDSFNFTDSNLDVNKNDDYHSNQEKQSKTKNSKKSVQKENEESLDSNVEDLPTKSQISSKLKPSSLPRITFKLSDIQKTIQSSLAQNNDFSDKSENEKSQKNNDSDSSSSSRNKKENNDKENVLKQSSTVEILIINSSSSDNNDKNDDSKKQKVSTASDEIEEIRSISSYSGEKLDYSAEVLDNDSDDDQNTNKEHNKTQEKPNLLLQKENESNKTKSDKGQVKFEKFSPLYNNAAIPKLGSQSFDKKNKHSDTH